MCILPPIPIVQVYGLKQSFDIVIRACFRYISYIFYLPHALAHFIKPTGVRIMMFANFVVVIYITCLSSLIVISSPSSGQNVSSNSTTRTHISSARFQRSDPGMISRPSTRLVRSSTNCSNSGQVQFSAKDVAADFARFVPPFLRRDATCLHASK